MGSADQDIKFPATETLAAVPLNGLAKEQSRFQYSIDMPRSTGKHKDASPNRQSVLLGTNRSPNRYPVKRPNSLRQILAFKAYRGWNAIAIPVQRRANANTAPRCSNHDALFRGDPTSKVWSVISRAVPNQVSAGSAWARSTADRPATIVPSYRYMYAAPLPDTPSLKICLRSNGGNIPHYGLPHSRADSLRPRQMRKVFAVESIHRPASGRYTQHPRRSAGFV